MRLNSQLFLSLLVISICGNVFLGGLCFEAHQISSDPLQETLNKLLSRPDAANTSLPKGYYIYSDEDYNHIAIFEEDGSLQFVTFHDKGKWRIDSNDVVETAFRLAPEFEYFGELKGNKILVSQGDYYHVYRRVDLGKNGERGEEENDGQGIGGR